MEREIFTGPTYTKVLQILFTGNNLVSLYSPPLCKLKRFSDLYINNYLQSDRTVLSNANFCCSTRKCWKIRKHEHLFLSYFNIWSASASCQNELPVENPCSSPCLMLLVFNEIFHWMPGWRDWSNNNFQYILKFPTLQIFLVNNFQKFV